MPNHTEDELTPEQKRKEMVRRLIAVTYETIRDCNQTSLGGIPNGHLYVMLSGSLQLGFDAYMNILTFLKNEGYITEKFNVLTATDKAFPWKSGV